MSYAIIGFLDYVQSSLDNKQSTIAVYLDFSKAFGRVNHDILMSKLLHNGICGVMQSWFRFYLNNRKICLSQKLQLLYAKHYIRCSARISVGPSTFCFVYQYTSEMFELVENRLYADDSTLVAVVRKPADRPAVAASLNRDLAGFRSGAITVHDNKSKQN